MASAIVRTRERPPRMPARRYLLGASDRVCVPLHQLLEGDGLRVCSTGDLEMWENQSQAGCRIPPPPSLSPSLRAQQGLGPGGGLPLLPGGPPTTSLRRCPAIHNQRRGRGQPSGRVALALVCAWRSHKFPQERAHRGGDSGHTPGRHRRPRCTESPETARAALPATGFTLGQPFVSA